jgi:hypothetical protein
MSATAKDSIHAFCRLALEYPAGTDSRLGPRRANSERG